MAQDTRYEPVSYIYKSRGLIARNIQDQQPEFSYLNMLNCLERDENSMSSRYGTVIINRDPIGAGTSVNYYFPAAVMTIAKLNYNANGTPVAYRYAGLANGTLYRKTGNTQGEYSDQLSTNLSGGPMSWLVTNCFETSQPYIFLFDSATSIKDNGTNTTAQLIGIDPPNVTPNAQPYSPLLTLIDNFAASNSYTPPSGMSLPSGWAYSNIVTLAPFVGQQVTDFSEFIIAGYSIAGGSVEATATSPTDPSASDSAIFSGFPSALVSDDVVTLSVTLTGSFSASVHQIGAASISVYYSVDSGTNWVSLYSTSYSGFDQSVGPITLSASLVGVSNLDTIQLRIGVGALAEGPPMSLTVQGALSSIYATPTPSSIFGEVRNGMLSLATSGSVSQSSGQVLASQYLTNIQFNHSQYEYNGGQIRTAGSVSGGTLTDYVVASGFNLSVPAGATITGVTVSLNWLGQAPGAGVLTNVSLFYGGSAYGSVKSPGTANTNYPTTAQEGSSSDLWGATLTPAIVNSSLFGFGVQITAENVGTTRSFLNAFLVTVYYSLAPAGGSVDVPIASAVSSDLSSGIYQTLTIATQSPHGLSGTPSIALYGTSNSLCDGFYQATVIDGSTLTVPLLSSVQIGSTGGFVVGGQAAPVTCVLSNFYAIPYPAQFSAWGFCQQVPTNTNSFPISCWTGNVAQNSSAGVGNTINLDLSIGNAVTDDDLIVLTIAVADPAAISNIVLQFDVNGSGYTASYYYKNISPAYFQQNVQQLEDAYTATEQQILADTLGLLNGAPPNSTTAQLQPGNISTGQGAWTTVYMRRGDFVPVGSAGGPGLDWSNITGWQVIFTTNTVGSTNVSLNGLYLQWGYGPSSIGGVGYNYRYTYYNANTGTESSPSGEMMFNTQFGYLASESAPFYLRQAAQVTGLYSADPQVTHIRMYRQGGTYASNWFQIDQVPNISGNGLFVYKDVITDASLAEAQPLALDNDPPVTSSLVNPVTTTLAAATFSPGNTYYSLFYPQTITVADTTATFVTNQIVIVGYPTNEEEVTVIQGGAGSFTAIVRLQHNVGEPVVAEAIPRQPCNLCAVAYDRVWLAGDKNNPHYLYYSKAMLPENYGPQNYIPVGTPSDPIMALVNWRGTLYVATQQTWYVIVGGGAAPYAQPTGSTHGVIAQHGWTLAESSIWYRASDGLRAFTGADGKYMSLPIEWIYRQNSLTPVPLADLTQSGNDVMCFYNNCVYTSYVSSSFNSRRYRINYDTVYNRYRNDDIAATAMLWERDTDMLLCGVEIVRGSGNYAIVQDQVYTQDYDDGGWNSATPSALIDIPITMEIQTPYADMGKPHLPKQFNVVEVDANTQGQTMSTALYLQTEPGTAITLANATSNTRQKLQLQVENGDGYQAYSVSINHIMNVVAAPILYQENIYAALLADYRTSFDTYWIKCGTDESKIIKQAYFDYTSTTPITVSLYADGNLTTPYYTFTLAAQPTRLSVRVLFPAQKMRLFRLVATASDPFQWWIAPRIEWKPVCEGKEFALLDLGASSL